MSMYNGTVLQEQQKAGCNIIISQPTHMQVQKQIQSTNLSTKFGDGRSHQTCYSSPQIRAPMQARALVSETPLATEAPMQAEALDLGLTGNRTYHSGQSA